MSILLKVPLDFLRGFGAIVEGAEFLLTHRALWRPLAVHFGASALLVFASSFAIPPLQRFVMPRVPPLTLPWYLAPLEWAWGATPGLLISLLMLVLTQTSYLAVAWPASVIAAVSSIRQADCPTAAGIARVPWRLILALAVCSTGCISLLWTSSMAGIFVAIFGMVVSSGAGLLYPARQSSIGATSGAFRFGLMRVSLLSGLGTGLFVLWMIPIVSLVSLPIGVAGATCLMLRERP